MSTEKLTDHHIVDQNSQNSGDRSADLNQGLFDARNSALDTRSAIYPVLDTERMPTIDPAIRSVSDIEAYIDLTRRVCQGHENALFPDPGSLDDLLAAGLVTLRYIDKAELDSLDIAGRFAFREPKIYGGSLAQIKMPLDASSATRLAESGNWNAPPILINIDDAIGTIVVLNGNHRLYKALIQESDHPLFVIEFKSLEALEIGVDYSLSKIAFGGGHTDWGYRNPAYSQYEKRPAARGH